MKRFRDTDYYVTEDGRVISTKYGKTREIKPSIGKGYYKLNLYFNNKRFSFRVHRLVAEIYHPNPNNLPEVEHIDDDKLNNHISNLEWVTHSENMDRAKNNGLYLTGIKHHSTKLTEEEVIWIKNNYINRDKEFGCTPLSRKFNVTRGCINGIIHNKNWSYI